ncbi:asparagine synthetase B family protein [Sphingomonas sp.]|jgi:asparagine synthase (glutamine-hydrolysing)|uniref:asparagine synthetase B family protein n=1 Tax=Sphingomonas sp. TaxID=28214 RepID=UPI002E32278C|nr:asparagine synthase-related protein [Sphingomonas sp.]HEX4695226.1 asparagine synthase-related protein [Sphingomonas sp.]
MTALAGFWALDGSGDPAAACERMLKAQQIYAPSDRPVVCRDDGAAIGRRLFRLLPEDRFDQGPARGHGRSSLLVADARLDNRQDLCAALGIGAEEAQRLPESALIMQSLERWGVECVDRLRGDFAFAWWDSAEQRLVLARDFFGGRPLHFHRGNGFFAFASMPKGLHALSEVPLGPDAEAVAGFLAVMPESGTRTFFQDIERVPPASVCIVTPESVSLQRYWNPAPRSLALSREGYASAVRAQLEKATVARLRGVNGRVASHLSGGLDSSAVAATAARLLAPDGRVVAFTAVPRAGYDGRLGPGRFGDEGDHAAAVAALHPNLEHILIRSGHRSPVERIDRHFFIYERPLLNLCNAVWSDAIMDAVKGRGISVLLTGQFGNTSFSYSGLERLPELLAGGRLIRLCRLMLRLRRTGMPLRSTASHALGPLLPAWLRTAVDRLRGRRTTISDYSAIDPSAAERVRGDARAVGRDFSDRLRRDPVAARLWTIGRFDPGPYQKGYLAEWGVDVRDPTGDRDLVELCLSIPLDAFLAGDRARGLARDAFADRLPPAVIDETRKGLQAVDWHHGLVAGREALCDEVDRISQLAEAEGLIDTQMLSRLAADWPETDWNVGGNQGRYRLALLRGVSAGHFLRKATGRN